MKVKVPFTWQKANATNFNPDAVRRCARPYRKKRLNCFITKSNEAQIGELKEWFVDNEVEKFTMFGVFIDHPDKVYFAGLCFEFTNEDHLIMFKLRFF